jgi:hypothetical protein
LLAHDAQALARVRIDQGGELGLGDPHQGLHRLALDAQLRGNCLVGLAVLAEAQGVGVGRGQPLERAEVRGAESALSFQADRVGASGMRATLS